jgi:hypothetical protein
MVPTVQVKVLAMEAVKLMFEPDPLQTLTNAAFVTAGFG